MEPTGKDQQVPGLSWRARLLTPRAITSAIGVAILIAAAVSTTVVSIEDAEPEESFDAVTYATERYPTVIGPYVIDNAVDLRELLEAIEADEDAAKEQYGNSDNPFNAYSYPVTFTAVVGEATEARLALEVEGLPDGRAIELQLSQFSGTALRDVSGTVDLNELLNQVEYLSVSLELHQIIRAEVIEPFLAAHPLDTLEGETVRITGVFRDDSDPLQAVPVAIEVVS